MAESNVMLPIDGDSDLMSERVCQ